MTNKCLQCGKEFEITGAELDYYKENGLDIPTSCRSCRRAERIKRSEAVVPKRRERRKNRRAALQSVPKPVFLLLVFLTFLLITYVRGNLGNTGNSPQQTTTPSNVQEAVLFRSEGMMNQHYEKHGKAMGYASAEEYLAGANAAINHSSVLHKKQKEDGDDVYYVEATNDFVVVSTDGYIRTYFRPEDGIRYYERQ